MGIMFIIYIGKIISNGSFFLKSFEKEKKRTYPSPRVSADTVKFSTGAMVSS